MSQTKAARTPETPDCRISEKNDRSAKTEGNHGTKPCGANGRATALASSAEARLMQAAREAFGLLGGED